MAVLKTGDKTTARRSLAISAIASEAAEQAMTEADARSLLRDCGGFGGLEAWMTEQPWEAAPGGWTVTGRVRGRSFRLEPFGGSLFITAVTPGGGTPGERTTWTVLGRSDDRS
jgi:hypothetical protein